MGFGNRGVQSQARTLQGEHGGGTHVGGIQLEEAHLVPQQEGVGDRAHTGDGCVGVGGPRVVAHSVVSLALFLASWGAGNGWAWGGWRDKGQVVGAGGNALFCSG